MGFREGFREGWHIAKVTHQISAGFTHGDPAVDTVLKLHGVMRKDVNKLAVSPTVNPTKIGYAAAGLSFVLTHGVIWNFRHSAQNEQQSKGTHS